MQNSTNTRPVYDTVHFNFWVTIWNTSSGHITILVNELPSFKEREGPLPCSKLNKSAEFSPLLHNPFLKKHFNNIPYARSRFVVYSSEVL
jgi:hypothetical protein